MCNDLEKIPNAGALKIGLTVKHSGELKMNMDRKFYLDEEKNKY